MFGTRVAISGLKHLICSASDENVLSISPVVCIILVYGDYHFYVDKGTTSQRLNAGNLY